MLEGAKGGKRRKLFGGNEDDDLEPTRKHAKATLKSGKKFKRN
jgi:hypothetical protein